jgi:hypothetical protein
MRTALFFVLLALALPLALLGREPEEKPAMDLPAGLSPEQVRTRIGSPARVSRVVIAHNCIEQWHYGPPRSIRLIFDCPRGQVPRLRQVRPAGRAP